MTDRAAHLRSLTDDTVDAVTDATAEQNGGGDNCVNCVNCVNVSKTYGGIGFSTIISSFSIIESKCPDFVDMADWQHAVEDGRRFLTRWGEQAERLGWTPNDLFGLADVPERPAAKYRRLSRYDAIGLIWLLHGRPVVTLSADSAVIGRMDGPTFYRHPQAKQVIR
jgi:hypothetical protein